MTKHRIKALRDAAGLSQEQLALAIGRTKSVISRIEAGITGLDLDTAQKIADTLNVPLADVLGIGTPSAAPARGFSEDVTPFAGDTLDSVPLAPNEYRYTVNTSVVENAGIRAGDTVTVNDSAAAVAAVEPLDVVVVLYHHPADTEKATHLLRQFVPPSLLITNARDNARSIDTAREDAHIVGVVTSIKKRRPNGNS